MKPRPDRPPTTPAGVRKLSEELAEFAQPLLKEVNTQPGFEAAIHIAAELWNIGALPEAKQGEALWKLSETLRLHPAMRMPGWGSAELAALVETRRAVYGSDRRIVAEHRVLWVKGQPKLEVVSYDLSVAEQAARSTTAPSPG